MIIPNTLPETNIAPKNGWLMMVGILLSYWGGILSGAMFFFREGNHLKFGLGTMIPQIVIPCKSYIVMKFLRVMHVSSTQLFR